MEMDTTPFVAGGRTYLPVRFVAETFGVYTTWDSSTRTTILERGTTTVLLTIGSESMIVIKDGAESTVEMGVSPIIRNGRTFMPVRFIAEAFGLNVEWHGDYTEEHTDGNVYRGRVTISEEGKTLHLVIGQNEILVYAGHFLKFFENDDFRFAYPLYPECTDLSEDGIVSFLSPPWMGLDRIITVTYIPIEGTSFESKNLQSVINHIGTTEMLVEDWESQNVLGTLSIAYSLVPPDRDGDIRGVYGVAFFYNDMLMRFEVSTYCENYKDSEGTILDVQAIAIARSLLEELLPTLTLKADLVEN